MRRAGLLLVLAAACSTEPLRPPSAATRAPATFASPAPTAARSPPARTARPAPTPTPLAVSPAPEGRVNEPRLGRYVFAVTGTDREDDASPEPIAEGTTLSVEYTGRRAVPDGVELTSRVRYADPTKRSEVETATVNTELWTSARLLLIRTSIVAGTQSVDCDYEPPIVTMTIPIVAQVVPTQTYGNDDCSGSFDLEVLGRDEVRAAGRKWSVWKLKRRTVLELGGVFRDEIEETAWFSPDLGIEVRVEQRETGSGAESRSTSDRVLVLSSHP